MTVHFTGYSRARCHLCDVRVGELRAATAGRDVAIQIVDVDGDDRLRDAYGLDVPVLTADGAQWGADHRVDGPPAEIPVPTRSLVTAPTSAAFPSRSAPSTTIPEPIRSRT